MKNLRQDINTFFEKLDERWKSLPIGKQHRFTWYFFVGYLLLTVGVVVKVWYDTSQSKNDMQIKHIENPILKRNENSGRLKDTAKLNF